MKRAAPRRQHGRGWFDVAVTASILGAFAWFWLVGLNDLQATSERTILDLTVRNMRTGLQLRVGELMLAQRAKEIPSLAGENPVRWLAQPPERYLGEIDAAPQDPPVRSWYFDRSTRTLHYVPAAIDGSWGWRIEPVNSSQDGGVTAVRLAQSR